jgi:SAM-dependent methyltransferase
MLQKSDVYLDFVAKHEEYRGTKRYCNICGYRFAKFAPFGIKPREARCPVCGSLERHRHLYIHLLSLIPVFSQGKRILHFAPERILSEFFGNSGAEYYDADISPKKASHREDITEISTGDEYFDFAIAIHVLEHIIDDVKALSELYRVLKPGGVAFLAVPLRKTAYENYEIVSEEGRLEHFGQRDHVRFYSLELFCERIRSVGFEITLSNPNSFPMKEECLLGNVIVLARKWHPGRS